MGAEGRAWGPMGPEGPDGARGARWGQRGGKGGWPRATAGGGRSRDVYGRGAWVGHGLGGGTGGSSSARQLRSQPGWRGARMQRDALGTGRDPGEVQPRFCRLRVKSIRCMAAPAVEGDAAGVRPGVRDDTLWTTWWRGAKRRRPLSRVQEPADVPGPTGDQFNPEAPCSLQFQSAFLDRCVQVGACVAGCPLLRGWVGGWVGNEMMGDRKRNTIVYGADTVL